MILQEILSKRSEIRRLVDNVWRFLQCFTLIDDEVAKPLSALQILATTSDETYQALIELCELANEYSEESFNREEGIRS